MAHPSCQPVDTGVDLHAPLETLHHSHDVILLQLAAIEGLPQVAQAMQAASDAAARTVALFEGEVLRHHGDEERELFPAVERSATPAERPLVQTLAAGLVAEHRRIEELWRDLAPALRAVARGKPATVDADALAELVRLYRQHAALEEDTFLPMAQQILGRDPNHVEALGSALHMRRVPTITGHL